MGINKVALKILEELNKEDFFKDISVIELGSQVFYPSSKDDMLDFLEVIGRENPRRDIRKAKSTKKSFIKRLLLPKYRQLSAKMIYKALGVKEYKCIDINGELDSINLDLNKEHKFKKQYDLVTNFGTTEHIFNQYTCFKNIHNLTKVKGHMIHGVPSFVHKGHGFYKYDEVLFRDLAKANGYLIRNIWFCSNDKFYQKENIPNEDILIFCIFKKIRDSKFVMPIQGKYSRKVIKESK